MKLFLVVMSLWPPYIVMACPCGQADWLTHLYTLGKHGEAGSVQINRNQAEPSQMQNSYIANSEVVIANFIFITTICLSPNMTTCDICLERQDIVMVSMVKMMHF